MKLTPQNKNDFVSIMNILENFCDRNHSKCEDCPFSVYPNSGCRWHYILSVFENIGIDLIEIKYGKVNKA